ncbi:hypothetical protein [Rhodanobacter sp. B04]|uniref:hypothetical protein n=1 Tax=Rhodanobacter sp. B04 TaxID=1945860 RepID=UPI0011157720|nr:hypothetical protein [Rhodanobacter sp. B04]
MSLKFTILISIRFGMQRWENVRFLAAVRTVEDFLNAEQNAFIMLKSHINADSWFTSYCSELLGRVKQPTDSDWSDVQLALGRARNAYDAGLSQEAVKALEHGVLAFNIVHKKFWAYREALSDGGNLAVTSLTITTMVVGAVFSAGVGALGASVVVGAAASAGLTLAEQTATNVVGVLIDERRKFDVADVVLQTSASFVSSLLSGKLCEMFATKVAQSAIVKLYGVRGLPQMTFRQLAQWAKESGVALPLGRWMTTPQEFLAALSPSFAFDRLLDLVTNVGKEIAKEKEAAKKKMGIKMTLEEFMDKIVEHVMATIHAIK